MKPPEINAYRFGRITIDGQTYTSDVIILPDGVIDNWWRISGHNLDTRDLRVVFDPPPEVLVIGQGDSSRMAVSKETLNALKKAGIEVIALPTPTACQRYNALRSQRVTAAALHLTC